MFDGVLNTLDFATLFIDFYCFHYYTYISCIFPVLGGSSFPDNNADFAIFKKPHV